MSSSATADVSPAAVPTSNQGAFSLQRMGQHFGASVSGDGKDAVMEEYLQGYEELNKMFPLLGRLFTFVQTDVEDKIRILREYLRGPDQAKYATVRTMMEWEKSEGKQAKTTPPSGCRTLLRLHRALAFVERMITDIADMPDKHGPTNAVVRVAYDATLSHHHLWYVRKGVHIAVHAIPKRPDLARTFAPGLSNEEGEVAMREAGKKCKASYDVIQELFKDYGMLDLP